jgi:ABC-2 type transport system ATP-binding protein
MIPVEISSVKKYYGSIKAVDGVSFSVNEGEIFSLLGPNGAGKTTLIEILEGLRKRDEGTVKVLGIDPWESGSVLHRKIGVIPQDFTFFERTNPREAVRYYGTLFGVNVDPDSILKEVLLDDSARVLFKDLSGGQKRKMGLALSLVNSPELLFLDEPTTGLDPTARRAVWDVIKTIKSKGRTVILTTHYLEEAEQLADRVAIMNQGVVAAMGAPDEIIETYGSGERLEVHGPEELANYIRDNTKLNVEYDRRGVITIPINRKRDALAALTTIEESQLEWRELHTRLDSLEDVFVKLIKGTVNERGEVSTGKATDRESDERSR